MAFIADLENLRTFDIERNCQLFSDGGGSGGEHRFIIKGRDGKFHFTAHKEWNSPYPDEPNRVPAEKSLRSEI